MSAFQVFLWENGPVTPPPFFPLLTRQLQRVTTLVLIVSPPVLKKPEFVFSPLSASRLEESTSLTSSCWIIDTAKCFSCIREREAQLLHFLLWLQCPLEHFTFLLWAQYGRSTFACTSDMFSLSLLTELVRMVMNGWRWKESHFFFSLTFYPVTIFWGFVLQLDFYKLFAMDLICLKPRPLLLLTSTTYYTRLVWMHSVRSLKTCFVWHIPRCIAWDFFFFSFSPTFAGAQYCSNYCYQCVHFGWGFSIYTCRHTQ